MAVLKLKVKTVGQCLVIFDKEDNVLDNVSAIKITADGITGIPTITLEILGIESTIQIDANIPTFELENMIEESKNRLKALEFLLAKAAEPELTIAAIQEAENRRIGEQLQ